MVIHTVALETAQQIKEALVTQHFRTESLMKYKNLNMRRSLTESCKILNGLRTFCGPCEGVWLVFNVLLVSWRTLLEPPALCFFPRRRLTKNSLEELLTREGLGCLFRMSLFHF